MNHGDVNRAGPFGRAARLGLGLCLTIITLPVYLEAGRTYVASSLALTLGLVALYSLLHLLVTRFPRGVNRWVIAVVAVIPVGLVWSLGQGGGLLLGNGEGGTATLTYLTVSFLVDFVRGEAGCEVMAVPSLILGTRTDVPCLLLCAIDQTEAAGRRH